MGAGTDIVIGGTACRATLSSSTAMVLVGKASGHAEGSFQRTDRRSLMGRKRPL